MKQILIIYPSMMLGGSTTSLLALLQNLDPEKYCIDLQLFRNEGVLFHEIPENINLLPAAERYTGIKGRIIKNLKFVCSGYAWKAFVKSLKRRKIGLDHGIVAEFQARLLSRKNAKQYDYAISFLEGWSDWYLGFGINAEQKYAWLHSTYANITPYPDSELPWMKRVDKIVFVNEACCSEFDKTLPDMAKKTLVIENLTDSTLIRNRALQLDNNDEDYQTFVTADAFKIITVCRIAIQTKGLDRIISCAKQLKEKGIDFLWYIIGDGEDMGLLHKIIKEADVGSHVFAVGRRLNPAPFIKAADIMCMPSRYEGKPLAITESMILGVPPVVTEYLAATEQIENGIDGVIVPNDKESLFPVLLDLAHNPQKIIQMKHTLCEREYGNREYIHEIENLLFT